MTWQTIPETILTRSERPGAAGYRISAGKYAESGTVGQSMVR
jgi:hypothetical protein